MAQVDRVAFIEDTATDATLFQAWLSAAGFFVEHYPTLSKALTGLQASLPDVILLDLNLPDAVDLEAFEAIRDAHPEIPIVILSGDQRNDIGQAAVDAGAQDYLPKKEINIGSLPRALRYAIERNSRLIAETSLQKNERDFEFARRVQEQMLPAEPPEIDGYDIAARCDPADATGGDFFDFIVHDDGTLDIVIADVSSHGFAPSLIMAGTRRSLRTMSRVETDLRVIGTLANVAVWEDTLDDQFVTMFFGRLNPRTGELKSVTAGHPAWRIDSAGNSHIIEGPNPPLGIEKMWKFATANPTRIEQGEILLFLTDGIWEAKAPDKSLYCLDRVLDLIRAERRRSAREILDRLYDSIRNFAGSRGIDDDLTAVLIKRDER